MSVAKELTAFGLNMRCEAECCWAGGAKRSRDISRRLNTNHTKPMCSECTNECETHAGEHLLMSVANGVTT